MAPLLVCVPSPLLTTTVPPVTSVLRPELMAISAPAPLVPLPAVTTTAPPRPDEAAPEPTMTQPLLPSFEDPVLNTKLPLEPETPEFEERTATMPLLVAVPSPVSSFMTPPVDVVLRPAIAEK